MTCPSTASTEKQLREELSRSLGTRPYRMWFSNTAVECKDDSIEILAATPLAANWINERFSAVIEDAAKTTFGRDIPVRISVTKEQREESSTQRTPQRQPQKPVRRQTRQLLSFDDFVIGTCNQLACSAAKQISQEDGRMVSPLFIHGSCGVGKTHLLQAICKHAAKTTSSKVRYVTAEQFTNEFIASSRSGEFSRFRNRYRTLDLLAIDDVHFVASKTKTQEELVHTLDAAGLRGARLVLASDEEPRQIRRLNRALANRFVAGMIAEIQRPDRETRTNIIQRLSQTQGIELTNGAVDRLASQAIGSIREIQGMVTRLRATATLFEQRDSDTIGVDTVERLLRSTPHTTQPIRITDVLEATSARSGFAVLEIRGRSRASNIVLWRSVASYLGRKLTSMSYPELAHALGRKNHSTVHAAVRRIEQLLEKPNHDVRIGEETIDIQEVVDQLTWAIRSCANGSSKKKPRYRMDPNVG
jgi:chromosomal replication initiator protein